jgi:diguanylate cyclase (GGDEF)-like protein
MMASTYTDSLILNVDDSEGALYAKTRTLKRAGFTVIEAASGSEALERAQKEAPDLVLLDVKLPDINGFEVCRRLKENTLTQSILVLQISASYIGTADKIRALDGGADNYLFEPIEPEELVANVKALLRLGRVEGELRAITIKMSHLAQHDFLTNLPNRVLLTDRITQAIAVAKRRGSQLALLFLDLDNFKHINDSLGHAAGDKLLQSVAQRLVASVRKSDTVSRQGGDEFVILLTEDEHGADLTADKILDAMALSHSIFKSELHVTSSIGISVYPADGQDAESLIKSADIAMYHAKEKGRNNYQFYNNDMNIRALERQSIEANLRHAIEKQEFVLHYQPKVNLDTGMITGTEALVRWMHREWGMVYPGRFVPIAEECGLIVPIGSWVLREACTQAKRWIDAGLAPISISVNISALEFRKKTFLDGVQTILNDTGLEASCLQLEITESVLMRDAESSAATLRKLKKLGVQLAVDDFGTGYSSLSYLKQFPIDVLKIDQSFVQDIGPIATDNGIIVNAVIGMANNLRLRVVAEGIENQAQLAFLKERHCDEGQGYLFSRPVLAEQFAALLETGMLETVRNC